MERTPRPDLLALPPRSMGKATALAAERDAQLAKADADARTDRTVGERIRAQVQELVQGFLPRTERQANTEGYARATIVRNLHVYGGTANPNAVAKRRARNRMARKTRQAQRRHG